MFLVVTVGFCSIVGSAAGAALGHRGLFMGGLSGGLLGSCAAAWLGVRLRWIPAPAAKATALGTVIGFLVAAAIAINTLRSPVGPVLRCESPNKRAPANRRSASPLDAGRQFAPPWVIIGASAQPSSPDGVARWTWTRSPSERTG